MDVTEAQKIKEEEPNSQRTLHQDSAKAQSMMGLTMDGIVINGKKAIVQGGVARTKLLDYRNQTQKKKDMIMANAANRKINQEQLLETLTDYMTNQQIDYIKLDKLKREETIKKKSRKRI